MVSLLFYLRLSRSSLEIFLMSGTFSCSLTVIPFDCLLSAFKSFRPVSDPRTESYLLSVTKMQEMKSGTFELRLFISSDSCFSTGTPVAVEWLLYFLLLMLCSPMISEIFAFCLFLLYCIIRCAFDSLTYWCGFKNFFMRILSTDGRLRRLYVF